MGLHRRCGRFYRAPSQFCRPNETSFSTWLRYSLTLWVPTRPKVLLYEDMISHNLWKDWAGESVKASSNPGDRTASLEVDCAHLWRHCYVVSGQKKQFSPGLGKPVASIQTATELKPNTLEMNFLHKNVGKDSTFAMMIKKVEKYFGGWSNGAISKYFSFLRFKPLFCQSTLTNLTKIAE